MATTERAIIDFGEVSGRPGLRMQQQAEQRFVDVLHEALSGCSAIETWRGVQGVEPVDEVLLHPEENITEGAVRSSRDGLAWLTSAHSRDMTLQGIAEALGSKLQGLLDADNGDPQAVNRDGITAFVGAVNRTVADHRQLGGLQDCYIQAYEASAWDQAAQREVRLCILDTVVPRLSERTPDEDRSGASQQVGHFAVGAAGEVEVIPDIIMSRLAYMVPSVSGPEQNITGILAVRMVVPVPSLEAVASGMPRLAWPEGAEVPRLAFSQKLYAIGGMLNKATVETIRTYSAMSAFGPVAESGDSGEDLVALNERVPYVTTLED